MTRVVDLDLVLVVRQPGDLAVARVRRAGRRGVRPAAGLTGEVRHVLVEADIRRPVDRHERRRATGHHRRLEVRAAGLHRDTQVQPPDRTLRGNEDGDELAGARRDVLAPDLGCRPVERDRRAAARRSAAASGAAARTPRPRRRSRGRRVPGSTCSHSAAWTPRHVTRPRGPHPAQQARALAERARALHVGAVGDALVVDAVLRSATCRRPCDRGSQHGHPGMRRGDLLVGLRIDRGEVERRLGVDQELLGGDLAVGLDVGVPELRQLLRGERAAELARRWGRRSRSSARCAGRPASTAATHRSGAGAGR